MMTDQDLFGKKLSHVHQGHKRFGMLIAPRIARMPLPMQRYDDSFLPFAKAIIDVTQDLVCAYVFDFAAYLAPGASGIVALERTIRYAAGSAITILHGPFVGTTYSILQDELSLGADAVTVHESRDLGAYLTRSDRSAFIVRSGYTGNADIPTTGGIFWQQEGILQHLGEQGAAITLRILGEDFLYVGRGDNFAQETRDAIARLNDASSR